MLYPPTTGHGDTVHTAVRVGMVVGLVLWLPLLASARSGTPAYVDPDTGTHVTMTALYSTAPASGFLPVRVTLTNHSGKNRSWYFEAVNDTRYGRDGAPSIFTQELTVPDQETKISELYVPILSTTKATRSLRYAGQAICMQVSGYGIPVTTLLRRTPLQRPGRKQTLPFMAMSDPLHWRSWPVLTKALETAGYIMAGSRIDPSAMPAHWRGYAGLWALLITETEWRRLPAAVRAAVVDWVLIGGRLYLFHRHELPEATHHYGAFRFERIEGNSVEAPLGLGRVALLTWDGREIGVAFQEKLIADASDSAPPPLLQDFSRAYTRQSWPLAKRMPEVRFSAVFLVGLSACLLVYSTLVGPFNVWWAARRKSRLRLFFTTPVFSVAFSVLLCVLLALRAGFGGWGLRTIGVYVLPSAKKAVIMQEQVAKTALVFSTDFTAAPDLYITPIRFAEASGKECPHYRLAPQYLSGDWFANNAIQAQFMAFVQPTRARVEILSAASAQDGAPPRLTIRSSINATLQDLYVRDAEGHCWHGSHIAVGQQAELTRQSCSALRSARAGAGPKLRQTLGYIERQRGVFVAVAENDPGFVIETLPTIEWKEQRIILFGHVPSATATDSSGALLLHTAAL